MIRIGGAPVDLNLLVVFDAIYAEGSVTRAARALHLSQPAVSHALGRLRRLFGDPLFERQGRIMVPTPAAHQAIPAVRQALQLLETSLVGAERFDPSLDFANAREILVELGFVTHTNFAAEVLGLLGGAVQNAGVSAMTAIFEKAVEGE